MATDNKYDRQLRLWGSEGQYLLNCSRVCVLNSSGLSSEILKNLVLPGIGFFMIIDDVRVSEKDLGDNFFVTPDDLGKSRAEVVKDWLLELNPDVKGESLDKNVNEILLNPDFFKGYSLVIASQVSFEQAKILGRICEEKNIKLIISKSNGLLGYTRIYCKEHLVIESKPAEKEILDLHLHKPFPELLTYVAEVDLDNATEIYHAHVPYIVILLKLCQQWESEKGSRPSTFQEKNDFKDYIKSKSRDFFQEMNFQEAVTKAFLCFINEDLPDTVMDILNDPKSLEATNLSEDY